MFFSGTLATPSTLPGYVFPLWPRAGLQSFHRHGFVFPGDLWRSVGSVCGFSWAWNKRDPIEPDLTIFESWDVKGRWHATNEWFIAWGGSTAVAQKCNKTRVNEKHGRVDHFFFVIGILKSCRYMNFKRGYWDDTFCIPLWTNEVLGSKATWVNKDIQQCW